VRRLAAVLTAGFVAVGALAGCGGNNWANRCTTTGKVVECTPQQRPPALEVTGELLDGTPYDLARERGRVVVVNFWGSWCGPCRAEAADLEQTYQATRAKGVSFLGVDSRDDRDSAKAFLRGRQTYPSVYDYDGDVGLKFDVTHSNIPSTLILDRQGRIAVALRGATTASRLQPLVEKIAAEGPPGGVPSAPVPSRGAS
jgi:thiol-disulfide isomerase/thioredoxin